MYMNLYFCLAVAVILLICLLRLLFLYEKLRRRYEHLSESCSQLQKLNNQLRSQRHDYLNHMQIVYGIAQLEEYGELRSYLERVYRDIMKTGKAIRTTIPAVNALLMAKMNTAEAEGIDFYVEVKSNLRSLSIEPWELCKVLSNLIDNAVTALSAKEGEKKLILEINEDAGNYLFFVSNNGPAIPPGLQKTIFRQGFTTKSVEGHGMGLSIVSSILKEHHGSIELFSSEEETIFSVKLEKER